jgi:exopolysaccharide biosynthesis polyprenyl glycosylphosphotransferase
LTLEPVALDDSKLLVKRFIDLILTLLALPFFLPIMALIALVIKLDDGGPVFFVQERVGLKKRLFPMLKFRTMQVNAEEKLKEIEHLNEAEGPNFKIANDPRITRIGRFLRRTSLDELPQLINVLRGDMSLVGPRPMSIRDVNLFNTGIQRKRFSVKPGITCIWQISGRNNLPFHKWLELDLLYIDTWSLGLDLMILLKTVPVVLLRKGAM